MYILYTLLMFGVENGIVFVEESTAKQISSLHNTTLNVCSLV